jgi:hypothetical protein
MRFLAEQVFPDSAERNSLADCANLPSVAPDSRLVSCRRVGLAHTFRANNEHGAICYGLPAAGLTEIGAAQDGRKHARQQ